MMRFHFSFVLIATFLLANCVNSVCSNKDTLVLSHVIFRHGNRTPSGKEFWKPNKNYNENYAPYGYGQLTNQGKRTAYNLGVILRKRFGQFLNDTWNTKIYEARTTDYDRTKMTAMLVLGGLFPPTKPVSWNKNIPWQPIPYNYLPKSQDKELSSWACPTTIPLIYSDKANMERLRSYDGMIKILSENIGEEVDYMSAREFYIEMYIQEKLGIPLDNWTKAVYPEPLKSFIIELYYIETSTKELKTVLAGYILKKILTDTINKINGTLSPPERKIYLYSCHEGNLATIMTALEIYVLKDIPPYASYLLFEVHNIQGVYGIKMFYEDYKGKKPHPLILPGCLSFCPLDDFVRLTSDIIPKSDEECLGQQ